MPLPSCCGKADGLLCDDELAREGDIEKKCGALHRLHAIADAEALELAAPDGMATAMQTARYGFELSWRNHCPNERVGAAASSAASLWPSSSCSLCPSSADLASYLRVHGFVGMMPDLEPRETAQQLVGWGHSTESVPTCLLQRAHTRVDGGYSLLSHTDAIAGTAV